MGGSALIDPNEFVGLEGVAHLCCGGEAPFLRRHLEVCRQFAVDKSDGMAGRDRLFAVYARAKQLAADRLGVAPETVAFLAHASEGLNQVAHAITWQPDDNVVVPDVEFPSGIVPFAALKRLGVETRLARTDHGYLSLDALAEAMDGRTRLLVASLVSYYTGQRLDLDAVATLCRRRGVLLGVDATHALGLMPVDARQCDFLVCSCYKWLLATHGVGLFAYRPERVGDLTPASVGWHSVTERHVPATSPEYPLRDDAARLEAGNPSVLSVYVLESALQRLGGLDAAITLQHALDLGDLVLEGLRRRGYQLLTPRAPEERAGNICVATRDAAELAARLASRGVLVWGSEGRLRISVHAYNSEQDVARLFDALDR